MNEPHYNSFKKNKPEVLSWLFPILQIIMCTTFFMSAEEASSKSSWVVESDGDTPAELPEFRATAPDLHRLASFSHRLKIHAEFSPAGNLFCDDRQKLIFGLIYQFARYSSQNI